MLARTRGLADHAEWRAHIAKTRQDLSDIALNPIPYTLTLKPVPCLHPTHFARASSVCQANAL